MPLGMGDGQKVAEALMPCISGLLANFSVVRVEGEHGACHRLTMEFIPFRPRQGHQEPVIVKLETRDDYDKISWLEVVDAS